MEGQLKDEMGSKSNDQKAREKFHVQLEKEIQESLAKRIAIQLHEQKQVMEANIRSELEAEYASKCERWKEEQLAEKKGASLNKEKSLSQTPNHIRTDPRASLVDTLKELHIGHTKQGHDLESDTISTAPVSCVTKRNSFKDLEEDTLTSPGGGSKQKKYEFEEDTLATQNSGQGETLIFEEKAELSPLYVGRIIGKGGEMIRDLQTQSGCGINVNGNVEANTPYIISYRGRTQEDIDFAKDLVAKLCTPTKQSSSPEYKHAGLSLGKATMKQIMVPKSVIGRIIGKGGGMIRELQSKSQARIQVDHSSDAEANYRQVNITGTHDAVLNAEQMILYFSSVRYMLGRKGATIKDIEQRTSCNIKIDKQNFQINITGPTRQGIQSAKSMLHDIIGKGPHNDLPAGGWHDAELYSGSSLGCASLEEQYCHGQQGYNPYITPPSSPSRQQQHYDEYTMYPPMHQQYVPYFPVQELPTVQYPFPPQQHQYYGNMCSQQQLPHPIQEPAFAQHQFPPQVIVCQWRIATTVDGQTYYYNTETGQTQWEKPAGM